MRILYIAHTSGAGGSSAALLNILKGMSKKTDVTFAVVCPEAKGYLVDELKSNGIETFVPNHRYVGYHIYPMVKNPLLWCKAMAGFYLRMYRGKKFIANVIRQFKPDIVHTNSSVCVVGWQVCQKLGVKHVWHIREFVDVGFGWTVIPSNQSQRRRMQSEGNYNIAITQSVFNHFNLRPKDTQIYDGVIDAGQSAEYEKQFSYPYFLFVGTISKAKGVDMLIEQFLIFHQSNATHHLVLAGPHDGMNLCFYEQMRSLISKAGASDYIHWLGHRKDVYGLMQEAVAIVVPSRNEGFGFITAEAMYNNCLVIGRNTAGTKEQFDLGRQETGQEIGLRFSIDGEMPMLMNSVIVGDYEKMKKRAHDVARRHYTIDANVSQIYDYYKDILSGKI